MVLRHGLLLLLAASPGCALVSGLANLDVDGGDASDASAGIDVTPIGSDASDASTMAETLPATRAMTALQTKGACTKTSTNAFPFSGEAFTIGLWLRIDASIAQIGAGAILWKGGESAASAGWAFLVHQSAITFCASDGNAQTCTPLFPLATGHPVHVVLVSTPQPTVRTLAIYTRDQSAGDTMHTLAASTSTAPLTWTTTMPFTIGGVTSGTSTSCSNASSVTIDDLRVYTGVQAIATFDANDTTDISCQGLIGDYTFNEGKGATATDCSKNGYDLTLGSGASFIASPFP